MTITEIKSKLLNGENFYNESSNWFTLCKPSENRFIIMIGEKIKIYNNINSISKKILKLINKGI